MSKLKTSLVAIFLSLVLITLTTQFSNGQKASNCSNQDSKKQYDCWRGSLLNTLNSKGLSSAFDLLAYYYDNESNFSAECHGFTHELGQSSYLIYKKTGKIDLTPKTSYCGYGFYHGFMEVLLQQEGSILNAEKFCNYADKQLSLYNQKTNIACYHGIGHGAVDGSGKIKWNSPQEFISSALKICKTISNSEKHIYECGTGVFNSLAIVMNSGSFDLNFNGNPYDICSNQEKIFQRSCYEQMNSRVAAISGGDLAKGVKYILKIKDKENAVHAIDQLAPAIISVRVGHNNSYSNEVNICKSLPDYLRKPCIEGLSGGILEFGEPGQEYVEALNLCKSNTLENIDKKYCYNYVIASLKMLYTSEKSKSICRNIDPEYNANCEKK
jgi:hypothetical protein